jgi:hypothetical protein
MPIARLNRDKLRRLSEERLLEAQALLRERMWTGAYYLVGLAVECSLKSCLAGAVKEHDFPDKEFVNRMYVHHLTKLFELNTALWEQLQADMKLDSKLAINWDTVKDWDDSKRYETVNELSARALFDAATESGSGVLEWIRRKW